MTVLHVKVRKHLLFFFFGGGGVDGIESLRIVSAL